MGEKEQGNSFTLFWRYVAGVVIVWSIIIGGSLVSNIQLLDEQTMALARKEAIANFNKDQGFRLWGTKHGGVYVPVTEETPPSPYLSHIPERDIETPLGRKLTLMNPAYMVRQLMDDHANLYGVRGKITGLTVLRPGNAPDAWERIALVKLKSGVKEVSAISKIDGETYYRLMRPMYMKPGCEKCHGHLGFKLGDFRGGVGVSVRLTPYLAAHAQTMDAFTTTHGAIWILGLAGIGFGARQIRGRVTERDRATAEAQASQDRMARMLDIATQAVISIDKQQNIHLFNKGAERIFGYTAGEIIGQSIDVLLPERFRKDHFSQIKRFSESGESSRLMNERREVYGRKKDGTEFPAEASISALSDRGENILTVILNDITARKKTEQEIAEKSYQLEATFENMSQGIAVYDANNILVAFNPQYGEIVGMPEGFLRPGLARADVIRLRAKQRNYSKDETEAVVEKKISSSKTIESSERTSPFGREYLYERTPTPDGGYITTVTDIAERREAEKQLQQSQKMEAVGQLTGGVAHDFNNLLAICIGNVELASETAKNGGDVQPYLDTVLRASERGAALTNQLLAFSRKQTLMPKVINVRELLAHMSGLLRSAIGETIEITMSGDDDLWSCKVDPALLENAILNLAINARDAMNDGGALTIQTTNTDLKESAVAADAMVSPGEYVMIAISDTGTGIPEDVINHVFDPFFTTKEIGQGSGLGLSMVYGFVKQSGGQVTAFSEEGSIGTTITLYLPRSDQMEQTPGPSNQETSPKACGETILVVEDDADVRALSVSLLRSYGYTVLEAADGKAAIGALEAATNIDLLFTDVVLPGGMSGPEIAAAARKHTPEIAVLYTSGYTNLANVDQSVFGEDIELLQKPYRKAELAQKVRLVLDQRKA